MINFAAAATCLCLLCQADKVTDDSFTMDFDPISVDFEDLAEEAEIELMDEPEKAQPTWEEYFDGD